MVAWLKRCVAFVVAWTLIFVALEAFDAITPWHVTTFVVAWICIGVGFRLQCGRTLYRLMDLPDRATEALRFLLRCSLWPAAKLDSDGGGGF